MRQLIIYLLTTTILTSCCCKYDDNDFKFSDNYNLLLRPYKLNDTIYFSDNLGDFDTITISKIDTFQQCGCIAVSNHKTVSIEIKHLPNNNWILGREHSQDNTVKILNQELISVSKSFNNDSLEYGILINYRDFTGTLKNIEQTKKDTILKGLDINNFWTVENESSDWPQYINDTNLVMSIYWTEKYGLTGYKLRNGKIYTIKKNEP